MNISQSNSQALKNPWVLGFLAFLFTFLMVNSIFIYFAFTSPPNLVVKNFYERGKAYEQTQQRIVKAKGLGWSGIIIEPETMRVHKTQTYEVLFHGKNSSGLDVNVVTLHAFRPSDARADFSLNMIKKHTGVYYASLSFNLPGIWDLIIEASLGEQQLVVTKRVVISP